MIKDAIIGEVAVPGFPIRFAATPAIEDLPAPHLGEHNAEILREYPNYTPDRIRTLHEDGILHTRIEGITDSA